MKKTDHEDVGEMNREVHPRNRLMHIEMSDLEPDDGRPRVIKDEERVLQRVRTKSRLSFYSLFLFPLIYRCLVDSITSLKQTTLDDVISGTPSDIELFRG